MSQEWYYARDNEPMGPVSAVELRRLAVAGQLRPDDLVWKEGLTEWSPASNVRGLFEDESKPAGSSSIGQTGVSAAAPGGATGAASATPAGAATVPPPRAVGPTSATPRAAGPATAALGASATGSASATPATPGRHFLDGPLDRLRRRFDVPLIERTAKLFWACGFFGLFAAMVLVAAAEAITATSGNWLGHTVVGIQSVVTFLVLQYVSAKVSEAMGRLCRTGNGALASGFFPDCFALLCALAGVASLLLAFTFLPLYAPILLGIGAVIAFGYLAILSLHPAALGLSMVPEVSLGEEAIGIISFLLRVLLRAVPVLFGLGVIIGGLGLAWVCGLGLGASRAEGPSDYILLMAAGVRRLLYASAALPLAAYLAFLLGNLILGLWHAVLSLPAKVDGLAAKNRD